MKSSLSTNTRLGSGVLTTSVYRRGHSEQQHANPPENVPAGRDSLSSYMGARNIRSDTDYAKGGNQGPLLQKSFAKVLIAVQYTEG